MKVRQTTCSLLADIGTSASLEALEKIRDHDPEILVRLQAKSALVKIRSRKE
jgi:hypothetical protein